MIKLLLIFFAIGSLGVQAQNQLKISSGGTLKSVNNARIVFNNVSVQNDGTISQENGDAVKFIGSENLSIQGTGSTQLGNLQLELGTASSLSLLKNISINSQLVFNGGLLNLNNSVVFIASGGELINENETSRAFTIGTGYLETTLILNAPNNINPGNLGAVFTSTKNMGTTVIRRGHLVQQNVAGMMPSIQRYYDINPQFNIALKASLKFNYFDAELNGLNESLLVQYKSKNPIEWDYVGADETNTVGNFVLRNNISKFSRWTLSEDMPVLVAKGQAQSTPLNIPGPEQIKLNAWPNPSPHSFSINVTGTEFNNVLLRVTNMNGGQIYKKQITTSQVIRLGHDWTAGVYIAEVIQGNKRITKKLVKQ
jgi:hypothetical protein